jgi:hypothetical protein
MVWTACIRDTDGVISRGCCSHDTRSHPPLCILPLFGPGTGHGLRPAVHAGLRLAEPDHAPIRGLGLAAPGAACWTDLVVHHPGHAAVGAACPPRLVHPAHPVAGPGGGGSGLGVVAAVGVPAGQRRRPGPVVAANPGAVAVARRPVVSPARPLPLSPQRRRQRGRAGAVPLA